MKILCTWVIAVSLLACCHAEKKATLACIKKAFTGTMDDKNLSNFRISHHGLYEYEYSIYHTTLNKMRNGPDTSGIDTKGVKMYFFPNGLFAQNCGFFQGKFRSARWGIYKMTNDTITATASSTGSFAVPFSTIELKFLVIDSNTLHIVDCVSLCDRSVFAWQHNGLAKLKPTESIPTYENCWMLEKKWFWKQEADWKRYMASIKPKKER
jgi:hypothetical protein